ncbi:hypothetical protein PILCRDRAFT_1330 [Piloderma croceum F 1598]|uniref:Uncharacterized protein n=1 Tax=Piloderma croceum (strain F 1598) TaxID=765440 RepID=A0A0C3CN85_PILCF|nr:hypothetical protein PILCRDRAFT_1330 [Piloderma croceum F 1598]
MLSLASGNMNSNAHIFSGIVGWITQLIIDKTVHKRYIITQLLQTLKVHPLFQKVMVVGLVLSHPTVCNALAKYANVGIYSIDLDFIHTNAEKVLTASNISYLKSAQPCGTLFQVDCDTGAVSSMFTEFYVDHEEPLEVLDKFKAHGQWCLGELLEGHEYLALFPVAPLSPIDFAE